jgi:ubiquinone/menaquinone biosynthesis C-methylase UbiE
VKHADIVALIEKGVRQGEAAWADLGSGDGAFTLALRELLGPEADIYSVDADAARLARQARAFRAGPGLAHTTFMDTDFTRPLELPPLDGILMANALHFVEDQTALLTHLRTYMKPSGKLLVVEYDISRGSSYVPHPVPHTRFAKLTTDAGFASPLLLATARSRYWSRIYSALAISRA